MYIVICQTKTISVTIFRKYYRQRRDLYNKGSIYKLKGALKRESELKKAVVLKVHLMDSDLIYYKALWETKI